MLLEKVFLANVVLYFKSFETAVKFMQINKKCEDVCKMLRYYPYLTIKENVVKGTLTQSMYEFKQEENELLPNNLFDIFPNVETIRCSGKNMISSIDTLKKAKIIEIFDLGNGDTVPKILKKRIGRIITTKYIQWDLTEFPNLKILRFTPYVYNLVNDPISVTLPDKNKHFDKLVVFVSCRMNLKGLKEMNNVNKMIIVFQNQLSVVSDLELEELKKFATVGFCFLRKEKRNDEFYWPKEYRTITEKDFDEISVMEQQLLNSSLIFNYKTEVKATENIDIQPFIYLTKLSFSSENLIKICIKNLTILKELTLKRRIEVDEIPNSVERIVLDSYFNKELNINTNNNVTYFKCDSFSENGFITKLLKLKELELNLYGKLELNNLTNLTKLYVSRAILSTDDLPKSLICLGIHGVTITKFDTFGQLTNLTEFICHDETVAVTEIIPLISHIKVLTLFDLKNNLEKSEVESLTIEKLYADKRKNPFRFTKNLKSFQFHRFEGKTIKIPTSIQYLYVHSVTQNDFLFRQEIEHQQPFTNYNQIQLKELHITKVKELEQWKTETLDHLYIVPPMRNKKVKQVFPELVPLKYN